LDRRRFLHSTLLTGAAGVLVPALGTATEPTSAPSTPASELPTFELEETTISDLQLAMQSGKLTARSITEKYLERISSIDKHGPAINSIIELNPDALGIADALDKERKTKGPRGMMHGVPVLIKDNIDTSDRLATTAGSLALVGSRPQKDAFIVQRLRQAGAVILGKTNLSEWANIRSSHSTSGWSGRGGLTRNPYALDRNPCGSSSGSGAAVSANLCAVAIGTETDGSIVCPSSANGIVGIKPTVGLASRSGIIPISHSQDTPGPMARSVRDAAILLAAIAGIDPEDNVTAASRGRTQADYTRFLDPNGLKGARLGIVRKYFGFSENVDDLMNNVIDQMKRAGATIVDPVDLPTFGKFDDTELLVLEYELKADLNNYLARLGPGAPVHSLKDIIEFNIAHHEQELKFFGQDIFLKAQEKGSLTETEYVDALAKNHQLSRAEGIDAVMERLQLDALVAPTGSPAWTTDLVNGDHSVGGSSNFAAVAGYPNINVPAGMIFGLPVGISFFGRAWSEPTLIKIAYGFEQVVKARKPPQFLATADLNK
jgi:amidase